MSPQVSLISLFLQLSLLLQVSWCKGGGPLRGRPQTFPQGYDRSTATRTGFAAFVRAHPRVNVSIPRPKSDVLRLVKFNVHGLRDLLNKPDNVARIRHDLLAMQPGVVAFQEVPLEGTPYRSAFDQMLRELGFKYQHFYSNKKAIMGNMIASKLPILEEMRHKLGPTRSILGVRIRLQRREEEDPNGGKTVRPSSTATREVLVLTTTTDSPVAEAEALNFIKAEVRRHSYENVFVAWENKQDSDIKDPLLINSFDALDWPRPPYTTWKVAYRDHIYCDPAADGQLLGAYMFLTTTTDHMPLILDVHCKGIGDLNQVLSFSEWSLALGVGAIVFLLATTAVGMYHWIQSKLDPFS